MNPNTLIFLTTVAGSIGGWCIAEFLLNPVIAYLKMKRALKKLERALDEDQE